VSPARDALRDKYARLVSLREERLAGADASGAALRQLATAFPGALRELDRAPLSELRARLALLSGDAPLPAWAAPSHDFHTLLRLAQGIRRAAGRERNPIAGLAALRRSGEPSDLLVPVLRPPAGRLTQWACEEVGRRYGLVREQVEELLFGHLRLPGP
jgi:hypothetical protein